MNPRERVVSSRVKSRKVLGSANPLAKGFREGKQGCMDSIGGIFFGIVLFFVAFWPAHCSVTGVEAVSKVIEELPLQTAEQAAGGSGLVKIQDEMGEIDAVELEIEDWEKDYYEDFDVLWYNSVLKEFTVHMETRTETETRTEGGQEVEYEIEKEVEVEDWETIEDVTEVADFYLGEIEIKPENSDLILTDFETYSSKGSERIGEEWLEVNYVPVEDVGQLLVVGELDGDRISSGDPFIVTDLGDSALVQRKATAEAGARTGLTILAIVLFFIAFNLIIGPLLFLLKYVPLIGPGLRFGIGVGSLILAIIWVLLFQFILRFWWLILILIVVLIVVLVMARKGKGKDEKEDEKEAPDETNEELKDI